ncbi:PITH domain-containing protein At3g04780,Thioredoxin-like protein 1 [Mytilus edulis]|uniref:PITH domain-containing protein At3g04780,Thioredoxin-like protein 1 n=1 Tax=Mytilus edulis TaxID=6550 RepID=A0A8S3PSW1_MYTED|nr:PITH domain-containing protein At3g04780,Thioredoxin-like protein 1 [Mytilus edulis]
MSVRTITEDSQFQTELTNAGTKLVVVDFYATWCGPCQRIAPIYTNVRKQGPEKEFLLCQHLSSTKTNKNRYHESSHPNALEEKIKQWKGGDSEGQEDDVTVKGHLDIGSFISSKGCECLNESDEHTLEHALSTKGGYLESDCDEQLIINLEFSQNMKLHSLKLYAPEDKGPKTVKIFQNLTKSLDFDTAENMIATQELELTPSDVKEGTLIPLRYVKFQNVGSIFIKDNLGGGDVTQIDYLGLVGTPVAKTNMTDFKRVAGKKGESH